LTAGRRWAHALSVSSLIALIFLGLAWELVLAPLRPGGSLLVLKVLPLLVPLFGLLRGKIYTYQWTSMLVLAYFAEGVVRAWSDRGASAQLAFIETVLALICFGACIAYVRRAKHTPPSDGAILAGSALRAKGEKSCR
jgi:uncharacterized membrane protein